MPISLEEVRHVARLARLELDDKELMEFQGELNSLLGHFQDIQDVDVSQTAPRPQAAALNNVWADDVTRESLHREETLLNAPVSKAGIFIVPTIIEE